MNDEELMESCREGLRRHEERLAAMSPEERANLELFLIARYWTPETKEEKSVSAMTLREARVLIASRAYSRTAEPKLLEAARVVLRELDNRPG